MNGIARLMVGAAALAAAGISPALPASDEPLEELALRLGLTLSRDEATGREFLTGRGLHVVLAPGLAMLLVNEEVREFRRPVAIAGGRLTLPGEMAAHLASRLAPVEPPPVPAVPPPAAPDPPREDLTGFRITIDAGHGGRFTGTLGLMGLVEKDVTLDVALRVERELKLRGATVTMTRTADRALSENWRQDLSLRADLSAASQTFVSIHANSAPSSEARGFEIFVKEGAGREDQRLAAALREPMRQATGAPDRGIKMKNLVVLRESSCPAILVEMEFLSNRDGARLLGSTDVRAKIASAVVDGLARWWREK